MPGPPPRRKRRIFMWFFLAVQVLFLVAIIAGAVGGHNQNVKTCAHDTVIGAKDCQAASDAGTTIGVGLLIGLWVATDVILALVWIVRVLSSRRTA
jgi:hypothetical protein